MDEVSRMLSSETDRLQDTARRLKEQRYRWDHLASGHRYFSPSEESGAPIDLRSPPEPMAEPIALAQHEDRAAFEKSHWEAQDTVRRLQDELGRAEVSLQQACSDGAALRNLERDAVRKEAEQLYMSELKQAKLDYKSREEALQRACEQLRHSCKLEVQANEISKQSREAEKERLEKKLHEADTEARSLKKELLEARISAQRFEVERQSDRDLIAKLRSDRDSLQTQANSLKTELSAKRAAELEAQLMKNRAESSSRTLAEEKLRLHADRGRLREECKQAEKQLQEKSAALQETKSLLEQARFSEQEAQRRLRTYATEERFSPRRHEIEGGGRDSRLVNLARAELADLLEQHSVERRQWEDTERRMAEDLREERNQREQVEEQLQILFQRVAHFEDCCSAWESEGQQNVELVAEHHAKQRKLEEDLEQEQRLRRTDQKALNKEKELRERTERALAEAKRDLERLKREVEHLPTEDSKAQKGQEALREAKKQLEQLKSDLARERARRIEAEAKLRTAAVASRVPAPPAAPTFQDESDRRSRPTSARSGSSQPRVIKSPHEGVRSTPREPIERQRPHSARSGSSHRSFARSPLETPLPNPPSDTQPKDMLRHRSNHPKSAFQKLLAQVSQDDLDSLTKMLGENLSALIGKEPNRGERTLMLRLYVVMAELQEELASSTFRSTPSLLRLWRFLELQSEDVSDGYETAPPEDRSSRRKPTRLL